MGIGKFRNKIIAQFQVVYIHDPGLNHNNVFKYKVRIIMSLNFDKNKIITIKRVLKKITLMFLNFFSYMKKKYHYLQYVRFKN